jgi:hypothetical protein
VAGDPSTTTDRIEDLWKWDGNNWTWIKVLNAGNTGHTAQRDGREIIGRKAGLFAGLTAQVLPLGGWARWFRIAKFDE